MSGPLSGLRVVELGLWVAGPGTAGILADWGADVIKIEGPGGDPARGFRHMLGSDLPFNPPFELDNRAKRSVGIDLQTDAGRELARDLVAQADVFVTNVRVAALERLGLGHEQTLERCPQLIYALITGYGLEGPDADKPAYDIAAFWARSGLASLLTAPGGDPPFQRGGMGDHGVAMTAAAAICAALVSRSAQGRGQLVSTSLLRQGAYTIGFDLNVALMLGETIDLGTRKRMQNPAMNNYIAGDGRRFWIVGLEARRHWPPLARVVGHPEWLDDPRFATGHARAANSEVLIRELDTIFATRPLSEWAAMFEEEPDMFWSPINSLDDLLVDDQFHAAGGLSEIPDPAGGAATMVSTPADFHGTPTAHRRMAPALGEHTEEVLAEMGKTHQEIAQLASDGVVFGRLEAVDSAD